MTTMSPTTCSVDFTTQTIAISQTFARAARKYGSYEYEALLNITRDLPYFRVEIKKPFHNVRRPYQPTYHAMEQYILENAASRMDEFCSLRRHHPYYVVLRWFRTQFPELWAVRDGIIEYVA